MHAAGASESATPLKLVDVPCSRSSARPGWREYEAERLRLQRDIGVQGLVSVGRNGEFDHLLMEDVYWRTVQRIRRLAETLALA